MTAEYRFTKVDADLRLLKCLFSVALLLNLVTLGLTVFIFVRLPS